MSSAIFYLSELWSHWLPMAFAAPILLAVVCLIDLYFVGGLYQDEWDGALVTGAFQLLPWGLVLLGVLHFHALPWNAILFALAGGALYLAAFFCYFRALFRHADSPLILVLWNGSVLLVPVLAWLCFDEHLLPVHYLGLGLAFLGASLFAVNGGSLQSGFSRVAKIMLFAVLFFSASLVLQSAAYRAAPGQFLDVFLIVSLGIFLFSASLALLGRGKTLARIRRLASFDTKCLALLVFAESLYFCASVASQRALDLAPSPSFVAAIESSLPVFVMLLSVLLTTLFVRLKREKAASLFRDQTAGWRTKLLAMTLMTAGIYCIAG